MLGHLLSVVGIQVDLAMVEVILYFLIPRTPTHVGSFIGCVGYYRHFIEKNKSRITYTPFQMLTKDLEFFETDECEDAF